MIHVRTNAATMQPMPTLTQITPQTGIGRESTAGWVPTGGWWRLDGERLGAANGRGEGGNGGNGVSRQPWQPVEGRHLLELMAADGTVLDSVSFAVRGPAAEPSKPADQQPHQQ